MGRITMEGPGRDRVAAVAGLLSVVAFVVGQYVAPALVWPAEQVGGLVASFYVNLEGRLLAEAILFGVAGALFLVFLGGLGALLGQAEGQQPRLTPVVVAAGAVAVGLVLLQAAILVALVALEESSLGVQAQGASPASQGLFYLHGQVGNLALFPLAVLLGAAGAVVVRSGVLARWLGWVGVAFGLLVGVLAAGSIAGLDSGPADQVVFLLVAAWLAVLAFGVGWPLPSVANRVDEALD
ncbi:MAG TPA: hypothetical protein VFC13_26720 [Actinomycetes bacterium]|nr:hypothetical protein [Actinomycetes bacterium]